MFRGPHARNCKDFEGFRTSPFIINAGSTGLQREALQGAGAKRLTALAVKQSRRTRGGGTLNEPGTKVQKPVVFGLFGEAE